MLNENIIIDWGFPNNIKKEKEKYKFIFNDGIIESNIDILKNLDCFSEGSKWCLYDIYNKTSIFEMDFLISKIDNSITLRTICVIDSKYRYKELGKYYLRKLIEFAINNKINKIKIHIDPDDTGFEKIDKSNILTKLELEKYYIKIFKEFNWECKKEKLQEGQGVQHIFRNCSF